MMTALRRTLCMLLLIVSGFFQFVNAQVSIGVSKPFVMETLDVQSGISNAFLLNTTSRDNISNPFILNTLPGKEYFNALVFGSYVPFTMEMGQQYEVTLTMENTGATAWLMGDQVYLGAVGDQDDFVSPASIRVALNSDVYTEELHTFAMTFQAPSVPGWYTTEWRMLKEGLFWFGETFSQNIEVVQRTTIDEGLWQLFE